MKERDHPVAGGTFLAIVVAGLLFAGKTGIETGRRERLKARINEAAEIGDSGDLPRAEQILIAISKNNPESAEAHFMLGVVLASEQKLDEADASFAEAVRLEPEDWESVAERATLRKMKGDVESALQMLESIPAGKGHLYERLRDEVWQDLGENERFSALQTKHGGIRSESGLHRRSE